MTDAQTAAKYLRSLTKSPRLNLEEAQALEGAANIIEAFGRNESALLKESDRLRAELTQAREETREYVEDGFLQGANRQEDGGYHTGGISTYRDLGDWLVEHAGWTRRAGGSGRMQTYDPPAPEATQ